MKKILFLCLGLMLLASCDGRKKRSSSLSDDVDKPDTAYFMPLDAAVVSDDDSLVVVEDFVPAAADATFLDFLYNFASDEEFQLSRIVFPLSIYNDTTIQRVSKDEWIFDPLLCKDSVYTVVFDREEELELEKADSFCSVQLDWIYLKDRYIKRYYFELKDKLWYLEAVNKESIPHTSNAIEDFYDFYMKFAADSVFQMERLNEPLLFSTVDPEDEFSVLETTLETGQWFAFRPPMPSDKLSNIRYGQSETLNSGTKVIEFKGLGNGFNNTLYFRRISGKWKLMKFEDLGD